MGDITGQQQGELLSTEETRLSLPASGINNASTPSRDPTDAVTDDPRLHATKGLSSVVHPLVEQSLRKTPLVPTEDSTALIRDEEIDGISVSREPVVNLPFSPPAQIEVATSRALSPPSENTDSAATLIELSVPSEYQGPSMPLAAPMERGASSALPSQSENEAAVEVAEGPVEMREFSVKQDKGKERAASPPAPVERRVSVSLSPQRSGSLLHVPSMTLTSLSGAGMISLPSSPNITPNSESKAGRIPAAQSAESDDYPKISNGLRTTYRKGVPPYKPRIQLPKVTSMSGYRRFVTKYAGEPLYQLSETIPYVLGPSALIERLHFLVEKKIPLPDEVRQLVVRNGLDLASLFEHDLALFNVLGCLWDD
ncbi:uncharacterized protein EKO05_0006197 [Ascochyta rabiei]|uniref:uncharacterized protein n=1 Tax=Didymella rabiei TaxID=5454 RepID=UPI002207BBEF|nr:uncharacterized protein EKO05_0006197 [Ascochyta rabiei]UPX15758.1 hypothetical protein EKO05_0006197 [Ascochyta rabiei]